MQTNLLRELADLAADEPGPSPILQSIDDLTAAVVEMGENVDGAGALIADLPNKIGAAYRWREVEFFVSAAISLVL